MHLTDYGSSPDLPDVRRVGQAFLGSQALARPAGRPAGRACLRGPHRAQDVWLSGFSGALCQPSLAVGTGLAELLATSFLKLFNKKFNEMRGPAVFCYALPPYGRLLC